MMLSRDRVLELFDVDLRSGAVVWKKPTSFRVKAGQHAAPMVGIDGKRYPLEHIRRLVAFGGLPLGGDSCGPCEPGWKIVNGFSSAYEVSADGRVRSRARAVAQANGSVRLFPAKLLKPKTATNGYRCVGLRDATTKQVRFVAVHELVAVAFVSEKPDGAEVRHLDGSRDNNRASNLAWGTKVDNMHDQYHHGTRIASTWHPRAKLTAAQVQEIRQSPLSGAALARELGLSVSTVCRARKAKTYAVLSRDQLPALLAGA